MTKFPSRDQFAFDGGEFRLPVLETRADELDRQAQEYLERNPRFWKEFCERAFLLIRKGHEHYGAKAIVENIRWHTDIGLGEEFKCNNNHTTSFARIFNNTYPEFGGFFRMRERTSERKLAK